MDFRSRYVNNLEVYWKVMNQKYRKGLLSHANYGEDQPIAQYESSYESNSSEESVSDSIDGMVYNKNDGLVNETDKTFFNATKQVKSTPLIK